MKKHLENSKGSIIAFCFIMGTIVIMLAISTLTIYTNDFIAVISNGDAVKAYYLAEIAVEETLWEIMKTTETLIFLYFSDLKEHKVNYLKDKGKETYQEYHPLIFNNYLQSHLINKLTTYKKQNNHPFLDYGHSHRYEVDLKYDVLQKIVIIEGTGIYNNARKKVKLELVLPYQIQEGIDAYDLPSTKIYPLKISGYHQIVL
ncbi:hypothetical protein CACET_c18360 [Clostridium aceticum]|uniref:Uncharacterized protein n=1 Tax=Clostridium aceticum TaxID=84022 RepID=A0A0D8IFY4_9CLOT|nr:hypothetical protein [Clostridium aceticum]AKL95284.1 hypothetical protein CACET_c18360 [Clostridium aceticum]KJF28131.1 hypothetical protein TZ02_06200 [Clostridium aceticum]